MVADLDEPLSIWTIYDHPTDMPDYYVARRFVTDVDGVHPTKDVMKSTDLELLRKVMREHGLVSLPRNPADDRKIIETWF